MKLSFHGAAKTVTGSKHILSLDNGRKILLDCGMFQGMGIQTDQLNNNFGFDPSEISVLFLSHAHIDHSGLIPKLVKDGFNGKIYCTEPTRDLTEILLFDSAEIQAYDTDYINRKRALKNPEVPLLEPLYTSDDVRKALEAFQIISYNEWLRIEDDIEVMYTNAGHLIGSASIHLRIRENGKESCITYSGDVGRYRSVLLPPPAAFPQADFIILESTYGDKQHNLILNSVDTLNKYIRRTCIEKKGKLIIPAFSVGRTQEVLYALNQLELEKRLPELKYFVDSPLSLKATQAIKKHTGDFNERLQKVLEVDEDPFEFTGLRYVETAEDSKRLVDFNEPCVIISASGTADAGRVRHHIFSCIDNANHCVLLVGYCEDQSLGGQLLSGAKQVEIFGDSCTVDAEIGQLQSMSAHGDVDDLCEYLNCQDPKKVQTVFLVHGEHEVQKKFAAKLDRKGFRNVYIPGVHEEISLTAG